MIGAMIGWALVTLVDFFEDDGVVLGVDGVSAKTLDFGTNMEHSYLIKEKNAPIIAPIHKYEKWS